MRNVAFLVVAILAATSWTGAAEAQPASCRFQLGFATLRDLVGAQKVGQCLDNESFNPANGNAEQRTTGGLLVWRKADNWTAFTDGNETWINGPQGLARRLNTERFAWEREPTTAAAAPAPAQPSRSTSAPTRPPATSAPGGPSVTPAEYLPPDTDMPPGFRFNPEGSGPAGMGYAFTRNYVRPNGARLSVVSTVQSPPAAAESCAGIEQSWRDRGFAVFPGSRFGEGGFLAFQKDSLNELWVSYFRQAAFCGGILWLNPRQPPDPDEFSGVLAKMAARVAANPPR